MIDDTTSIDYIHHLVIKLSREINLVNPNDLLAQRVTDIAKTNDLDSFVKEIHAEILAHAEQEATGPAPQPVQGITVHDSKVLAPEPVRQGGLMRKDAEKRREAAEARGDGQRKRPRLDNGDKPKFKVPSLPASRGANMRQRGEDTPSHPGGLFDTGRKRLEEHRRNRDKQREGIPAMQAQCSDAPKGLDKFQRRANREGDRGWRGRRAEDNGNNTSRGGRNWDATPSTGDDSDGWGDARNRRWDAPTPRAARGGSPDDAALGIDAREWEEEQTGIGAEEGVLAGHEEHNLLSQYEDLGALRDAEIAHKQVNADNDLWEANRMVTSGVATRKALDLDFEDDPESTIHVMVHDLKPPFLDGRTVFTKQLNPINPIRDATSDMAIFSKKGSALVKEKREQAERAKAAAKLAALGGTALGNIMGVKDEEAEAEAEAEKKAKEGEKEDYKGDSTFASHLKSSSGVSTFAKTRTLKEQREYLPAFACREDLMRTIRDNQVIVFVGETGSGKTTQLAQFLYEGTVSLDVRSHVV
ncbi:hypothetical protein HGRIS_001425 [Hohenbuehelia grisea]|uniref:ATP-dependent RNA helicase n=1 Tax=Hohenbuehelia grisea TaxID=104357 RepID=A0ABR3JQK5_9AGAR